MTPVATAFVAAAEAARGVLESDAVAARWDEASVVEGFTVGGLAAHLLLATARTKHVLDEPEPTDAEVVDLAGFYGVNRLAEPADAGTGLHPLIREAAARDAARGSATIAADFADLTGRLADRLWEQRPDRLVTVLNVPGGATPLATYLATRVVELVVHTDDLACSAGVEPPCPPAPATEIVLEVFLELARARSGDLAVVRAFARRERADPDALRVL